jgi:hypothetical protein
MNTADQLFQQACTLPPDQRLALAHKLLADIEPACSEEVSKAWDIEIRERIARYDNGEAVSKPANEVFASLDAQLSR